MFGLMHVISEGMTNYYIRWSGFKIPDLRCGGFVTSVCKTYC